MCQPGGLAPLRVLLLLLLQTPQPQPPLWVLLQSWPCLLLLRRQHRQQRRVATLQQRTQQQRLQLSQVPRPRLSPCSSWLACSPAWLLLLPLQGTQALP